MDIATIEKEFAPYRNKYGFVVAGNDTAHMPLFHGFYLLILDKYGLIDEREKVKQRKLFQKLMHPQYPGLLLPRPYETLSRGNPNWYSHDTHKAMFWISQRIGMSFAQDFIDHGKAHNWNWNPKDPTAWTKRGTYWRFPAMMAQADIAAGNDPNPFFLFWLYSELGVAGFTGRHKRVEKITLPVFICKTIENYGPSAKAAVAWWRWRKFKAYSGGLGEVLDSWGGPWRGSAFAKHLEGVL